MESNVAGIETADYEVVSLRRQPGGPGRAVRRRLGGLQHRRPVQPARPGRRRGRAGRRRPLPRHHRRAGLADHLRRAVRRGVRREGSAAGPGRRADVHDRRDRGRGGAGATRPRHPRHRGVLGRQPDRRLDADHPGQRRPGRRLLPRAEPVPAVGPGGRPLPARHPRPARAGAGPALGRHLAPGLVQAGPARRQRQGPRRRLQQGADDRGAADRGRGRRGDQGHGAGREVRRAHRHRLPGDEPDAAAGEPAAQQVDGLGARLRARSAGRTS